MGLALDEPKDNDKVFEEGTLKFVVDEQLIAQVGAIKVDFIEAGDLSGLAMATELPGRGRRLQFRELRRFLRLTGLAAFQTLPVHGAGHAFALCDYLRLCREIRPCLK